MQIPACKGEDICTIKQFVSSIADVVLDPAKWGDECKDNSLLKDTVKLTSGNNSFKEISNLMDVVFL